MTKTIIKKSNIIDGEFDALISNKKTRKQLIILKNMYKQYPKSRQTKENWQRLIITN